MTSALLNKVWEGDCLKLMQGISNQSVDMILTDLPYATTANKWDKPIALQMLWQQTHSDNELQPPFLIYHFSHRLYKSYFQFLIEMRICW